MLPLQPSVRTYDWGMPVGVSTASLFVAETDHHHDRIAELWWGHPHVMVRGSPDTFRVPYLLKLLFVGEPLSLQVHPTRGQVQQHPDCFPDPSPKPEMVVALTGFEALCGFLSPDRVQERIGPIPALAPYPHFSMLFDPNPGLVLLLEEVRGYAVQHPDKPHCRVFLSLLRLWPLDPAVLCPFYMEYVSLQEGEALVIPASQPHCYLSGQGVECMPPSDNVVRCGLTKKPCDPSLFFQIASPCLPPVLQDHHPELDPYFRIYLPTVHCFCPGGSIVLVLEGEGEVDGNPTRQGGSWLVETGSTLHFPDTLRALLVVPGQNSL